MTIDTDMDYYPWEITISPKYLLNAINLTIGRHHILKSPSHDGAEPPRDYVIKNEGAIEGLLGLKEEIFKSYALKGSKMGEDCLKHKAEVMAKELHDADNLRNFRDLK